MSEKKCEEKTLWLVCFWADGAEGSAGTPYLVAVLARDKETACVMACANKIPPAGCEMRVQARPF